MATYTENLNLKLPAGNEQVSRQDLNANFEAIDENVVLNGDGTVNNSLSVGSRHITGGSYGIGQRSAVVGDSVDASGENSAAFGYHSTARGKNSLAAGRGTETTGEQSAAFGYGTDAFGEGSFAAGYITKVLADYSFAFGAFNKEMHSASEIPQWVSGTHYYPYDIVRYGTAYSVYMCKEENSDSSFNSSKWIKGRYKFVEMIGNGFSLDNLSNARALDWAGNQYLMGTLVCECNADSSGGKRLVFNQDGTVTWEAVT